MTPATPPVKPAPLDLNLGWLDLVVRDRPLPRRIRPNEAERLLQALASLRPS